MLGRHVYQIWESLKRGVTKLIWGLIETSERSSIWG